MRKRTLKKIFPLSHYRTIIKVPIFPNLLLTKPVGKRTLWEASWQ
jgi:hypothetical protein